MCRFDGFWSYSGCTGSLTLGPGSCPSMKALCVLALTASAPSFAFAQAAIAGSVKDGSGVPLPGVMVQAASPALIERARLAVTDSRGQYRIENLATWNVCDQFHAQGLAAVPARRDRAVGFVHRRRERRAHGRRRWRNRHRHRRASRRRCPQPDPRARAQRRRRPIASNRSQLQRAARARARRRHHQQRHRHRHGDDVVSRSWRPDQRGPAHARRPEHRQPAQRQLGDELRRRRRHVTGGDVPNGDGARRNRDGRARHEHRHAERRQHDCAARSSPAAPAPRCSPTT